MIPDLYTKIWLRAAGVNAGWSRRPFSNFTPEQEQAQLDIVRRIQSR